ncbi:hypothetical protein HPP92_026040 [Vanilla planifolia]|uniref:Uncharacterized protein n=1 Tax=Vanilla planifolia TaxID=51239 RepID=A0A835PEP5_VANPL|nr:hypothetical protein HPP92_026313 [Vanilla planifolia]KAG0451782.1 hypothetical protein HPP92_026040 [Vanilla planifolia]
MRGGGHGSGIAGDKHPLCQQVRNMSRGLLTDAAAAIAATSKGFYQCGSVTTDEEAIATTIAAVSTLVIYIVSFVRWAGPRRVFLPLLLFLHLECVEGPWLASCFIMDVFFACCASLSAA